MVITVNVKDDGNTLNIEIRGHANYDQHGRDIVCSAVSAISQTAILGLQAVAYQYPENVQVIDNRNEG